MAKAKVADSQELFTLFIFLILEQFLGAKLENVVELLLGHHGALVAEARPDHQVCQHHLALGHLSDALLHRVARHKTVDEHAVCLADTMRSTERLPSTQTNPSCIYTTMLHVTSVRWPPVSTTCLVDQHFGSTNANRLVVAYLWFEYLVSSE